MSRLQEAVDKFAAAWYERTGDKPEQDALYNGTFSRSSGQAFCLCFKNFTGLGQLIDFTGLTCTDCLKPVTKQTHEWGQEAREARRAAHS